MDVLAGKWIFFPLLMINPVWPYFSAKNKKGTSSYVFTELIAPFFSAHSVLFFFFFFLMSEFDIFNLFLAEFLIYASFPYAHISIGIIYSF